MGTPPLGPPPFCLRRGNQLAWLATVVSQPIYVDRWVALQAGGRPEAPEGQAVSLWLRYQLGQQGCTGGPAHKVLELPSMKRMTTKEHLTPAESRF